jgi:peptidoglycan/xylan/chitin deacetylase (PgdA/CDA1 family)
MSWSELDTLQSQGDDIGSHTIDHSDLTTLSAAQITQEVCGSRQDMINNGIQNPVSFAYPFGNYNATAESIVQQCGFTNARIGGGISTSNTTPTAPYIETLPPKDPMAVRTIAVDGASPITLADLESFVTSAAAHGGGWLPITFHDVCDQAAADWGNCMSTYGPIQDTVFGQFLDWLKAAGQPGGAPGGVIVKTMSAAMNLPGH